MRLGALQKLIPLGRNDHAKAFWWITSLVLGYVKRLFEIYMYNNMFFCLGRVSILRGTYILSLSPSVLVAINIEDRHEVPVMCLQRLSQDRNIFVGFKKLENETSEIWLKWLKPHS